MSNTNPGGHRGTGKRLFSATAIERHCKPQLDRMHRAGEHSIANQQHSSNREIERRRRQRERQEAKRG